MSQKEGSRLIKNNLIKQNENTCYQKLLNAAKAILWG